MSLMLAGRVLQVDDEWALVDVDGAVRRVRLGLVRDVKPGDYVRIYYGIVLEKLSREEAEDVLGRCSYRSARGVEMTFSVLNLRF